MNRDRAEAPAQTAIEARVGRAGHGLKERVGRASRGLRAFWAAPPAADPPRLSRWEWAIAAGLVITVALEVVLRADLVWRPVALAYGLGLAGAFLVRRTDPLAAVAFSFGTFALLAAATFLAGTEPLLLYSASAILDAFAYSLFRWGAGRAAVIGSGFITAGVAAIPATDPADAISGVAVVLFSAALALWIRHRVGTRVPPPYLRRRRLSRR